MTRKAISIYMAAICAIVIVAPGRFVCGIVIAVELICLMLFGLLLKSLLKKMNLEKRNSKVSGNFFALFCDFFYSFLQAAFDSDYAGDCVAAKFCDFSSVDFNIHNSFSA